MQDRRQEILDAGLATLREHGYAGFTQPRVAARARLRQSHLTYYFPTRADLLAAVARAAIDAQLAAIDAVLRHPAFRPGSGALARLLIQHENTRVLMALAQAADQEPPLRALFRELANGVASRILGLLKARNPSATEADARLLHAVAVGLAVTDLATGPPDAESRAAATLQAAFAMISSGTS